MNINHWLAQRSKELEIQLGLEARTLGLIGEREKIACVCDVYYPDEDDNGRAKELIYPLVLTDEDRAEIQKLDVSGVFRNILIELMQQNPKPSFYTEPRSDGWGWSSNYQCPLNNLLRAAGSPFRVVGIGKWNKKTVHLGTTVKSAADPITSLTYKLKGKQLRRQRVRQRHLVIMGKGKSQTI